jgi:hypothetical protein
MRVDFGRPFFFLRAGGNTFDLSSIDQDHLSGTGINELAYALRYISMRYHS